MGQRFGKSAANASCCTTTPISNTSATNMSLLPVHRQQSGIVFEPSPLCGNSTVQSEKQQFNSKNLSIEHDNCKGTPSPLNCLPDEKVQIQIVKDPCIVDKGEVPVCQCKNSTTAEQGLLETQNVCPRLSDGNKFTPLQRIVITIHLTKMEIEDPENIKLPENLSVCEINSFKPNNSLFTTLTNQQENAQMLTNINECKSTKNGEEKLIKLSPKNNYLCIPKSITESLSTLMLPLLLSSEEWRKTIGTCSRVQKVLFEFVNSNSSTKLYSNTNIRCSTSENISMLESSVLKEQNNSLYENVETRIGDVDDSERVGNNRLTDINNSIQVLELTGKFVNIKLRFLKIIIQKYVFRQIIAQTMVIISVALTN